MECQANQPVYKNWLSSNRSCNKLISNGVFCSAYWSPMRRLKPFIQSLDITFSADAQIFDARNWLPLIAHFGGFLGVPRKVGTKSSAVTAPLVAASINKIEAHEGSVLPLSQPWHAGTDTPISAAKAVKVRPCFSLYSASFMSVLSPK